MSLIPSSVFTAYYDIVDSFIDEDFGVTCSIFYKSERVACSCSQNHNLYGGVSAFNNSDCIYCGGIGYKEQENSETIKLRVYSDEYRKKWIQTPVNTPDGTIQVIGYLTDLDKIKRADYIVVNIEKQGIERFKYKLFGEPFTHGFKHSRYFIGYFERC